MLSVRRLRCVFIDLSWRICPIYILLIPRVVIYSHYKHVNGVSADLPHVALNLAVDSVDNLRMDGVKSLQNT